MATITTEKVTFTLPAVMVRQMREVVQKGGAASQNALVREALQQQLKRLREVEFECEMEAAARDPLFAQDLEECMNDFRFVDFETASTGETDGEFGAQH